MYNKFKFPDIHARRYMDNGSPIVIQHSKDVLSEITSRIYAIYLQKVLGYVEINMKDITSNGNESETNKLYNSLEMLVM